MSHLHKSLATLGMLLFFILAGFAVSLAHDCQPAGPVPINQLRGSLKHGPAQVDRYTLRIGMDAETGVASNCAQAVSQESKPFCSHPTDSVSSFVLAQPRIPRVSLQIFDSVLLF